MVRVIRKLLIEAKGYSVDENSTLHLKTHVRLPDTKRETDNWRSVPLQLADPQAFHTFKGIPYFSLGGSAGGDIPLVLCEDQQSGVKLTSSYGHCHFTNYPERVIAVSILLAVDHCLGDYLTLHGEGDLSDWESAKDLLHELSGLDVKLPRSLVGSVETPSSLDFRS